MKFKARTVLAFVAIIGYILITGGFFYMLSSGRVSIPEGDLGMQLIGMFGLVIGNWGAIMLMVFTFNFGTSQGSVDKGIAQKEMIEKLPKPQP